MGGTPLNIEDKSKLIDLAFIASLAEARVLQVPGREPVVAMASGMELKPLPFVDPTPLRDYISQNVEIVDLQSYIAYIKQFKTHTTAIFAIVTDVGAKFATVLDYHEGGREGKPFRGAHNVSYAPTYSPEYKAWADISGQPMTQEKFLDHLRKWGDVIQNLSDADLIEMASSLDFTAAGEFSSHVERVNGGRKLLINERIEGSATLKGKSVTVPDALAMEMPVFMGGASYQVNADILYRPQNGALKITVELRRQHLAVRQAVKDLVDEVKAGTEIEPFLGRLT